MWRNFRNLCSFHGLPFDKDHTRNLPQQCGSCAQVVDYDGSGKLEYKDTWEQRSTGGYFL